MAVSSVAGLGERLSETKQRIAGAAERAGRAADEVTLIAVTKGFGADVIRAALDAGLVDLGENRAQEFRQKANLVGTRPVWHFVGHLQSNKARHVVGTAALIHSIDGSGLGEAASRHALRQGVTQDILIEVNVTGESSKHGVEPERARHLADELASFEGLRLRGLMTMAPYGSSEDVLRRVFTELRELRDRLVVEHPRASHLSMGMSNDFEVAVEEGASLVRIGEALFGPRPRRTGA